VFSDINGISRYIIDKHAFDQLRKYYLNEDTWRRQTLKSYIKRMNVKNVARAFMAMLSPEYFSALRETVFTEFSDRLQVYALKDDEVFPEEHIMENFNSSGVWVNRLDFPYHYSHETPFPISKNTEVSMKVDKEFDSLFKEIGHFLRDDSNYDFSVL
jgi:phosphoenolpyruvate synthase/pyruvate phosphate dikinase